MATPTGASPAHVWLRQGAVRALAAAQQQPDDPTFAMSALIHTALMAETFFDLLGGHLDRDWAAKGRRFSKYKRLRVFRLALGIAGDIAARPWRSVADAFDFHDLVVHGRIDAGERHEALELSEAKAAAPACGGDWSHFCTAENARRVLEDVEAVIVELQRAAGLGNTAQG